MATIAYIPKSVTFNVNKIKAKSRQATARTTKDCSLSLFVIENTS
jgi:hypothetical protein